MSGFTEGPSDYLTIQFLEWLSERPRTYGDTMEGNIHSLLTAYIPAASF